MWVSKGQGKHRKTANFYHIVQKEFLPELLQDVMIAIRKQLCFQHYRMSVHLNIVVCNGLNANFRVWWIKVALLYNFRKISLLEHS